MRQEIASASTTIRGNRQTVTTTYAAHEEDYVLGKLYTVTREVDRVNDDGSMPSKAGDFTTYEFETREKAIEFLRKQLY